MVPYERWIVLSGIALFDLSFAAMLDLCGAIEPGAEHVGLLVLTLMSATTMWLALRSDVRGLSSVALAIPSSVAAAWCVAAAFAASGSMHFIHFAGMSSRGTDTEWIARLTWIGCAHGSIAGAVIALVMRARSNARRAIDGSDHACAWAFGSVALVGAMSVALVGITACAVTAIAEIALLRIAMRDVRRRDWAERVFTGDRFTLGPALEGVPLLTMTSGERAGVYPREPGLPYRGIDREPVLLVPFTKERAIGPLRLRAWSIVAVTSTATAIALVNALIAPDLQRV